MTSSYDRDRNRRPPGAPAYTVQLSRLSKRQLEVWRAEVPEGIEHARPRVRGDCVSIPRPCPFVGCKYNLYLDVAHTGNLKLNHPDLEPGEMRFSCCLDLAELGGMTLEQIGGAMNMTRERARQAEGEVLAKFAAAAAHLLEEP